MKSLEHIIREIREGKGVKGDKKNLEHSIRKVVKGEAESSFADRTSKPLDEDVGGLAGSGTGGEPKLHTEDGKKKKDVKEAIGTIGTDKYQGNEFKSIRSSTPHIKPPGPEHGHSQAPENASRQRSIAKEKAGINRVTEQAALALPAIGAGLAAGAYLLSPKGKVKVPTSSGAPDIVDKFLYPSAEELAKAGEAIKAGTKTKPVDEPEVAAANAEAAKKAAEKKAKKAAEEQPKPPEVSVKKPEEFVPQKDAAVAAPQPKAPQGPEMPPPLPAQTRPETKTAPGTKTRPVEIPTPDKTEPAPKRKEVGPPMPAETRPAPAEPAPKKWKEVGPEMPAAKPAAEPKAEPATKTKTAVQPSGVVHPTTGANIATNAGRAAVAPKTDTAVNTKTATDADTKTTTTTDEPGKQLPSFGGAAVPHAIDYTASHLTRPKVGAGHAKAHKKHAMREAIEAAVERKKIENMPRKGDRKSIEYVGRNDAEPKTSKEKTSRLATIRNVIDEAKKEIAKKINYEDGKTKVFDYGKDILIINPDQKRIDMDVDGNKIPKDYDNK